MSGLQRDAGTNTFHCPSCAARFAWTTELAGRRVRCKCGTTFAVPAGAAAGPADLDFAPEEAAPTRAASASGVPPQYAHYAPLMPKQYTAEPSEADAPLSPFKDLYLPGMLLIVGIALRLVQLLFFSDTPGQKWGGSAEAPRSFGVALVLVVCEMIVNLAVMLGGAALGGKLMEIEFGPLGRAAFKLCATVVFAVGVGSMVAVLDRDRYSISGLAIAWHVIIVIYWISFAYFFSLGLQENVMTVAIIAILQALLFFALWGSGI